MEPIEIVPKSFGCFSHKGLKFSLNSFRSSKSSSSNLSSPSPRSPKSPNITTQIFAPKTSVHASTGTTDQDVFYQVFRRFDGNNDGKISALELRSYFATIGEYMSHEEAQGVIDDSDTDGDNLIDFQDFMRLMRRKGEGEGEDLKAAFETFEMEKGRPSFPFSISSFYFSTNLRREIVA